MTAKSPPPARELNLLQGKVFITLSGRQRDRDKEHKPRLAWERLCRGEQAASSTPDAWFGKTFPSKGTTPGPSPWASHQAGQSVARAESGSRRPARELLVPDAVPQDAGGKVQDSESRDGDDIQPITSQVSSLAGALEIKACTPKSTSLDGCSKEPRNV